MDENMSIEQLDKNIEQLEKEIRDNRKEIRDKKEEIRDINTKRNIVRNRTLAQIVEKIIEKIVEDKLYKNEDPKKRHILTTVDPNMVLEGVVLTNYKIIEEYLAITEIEDNDSDVLSITLNIKYDKELREIMDQNWDTIGRNQDGNYS